MDPITRLVHAGQELDAAYNSITAPLYQTSVFRYEALGQSKGYEYSRAGNPTRHILESLISDLEGGTGAVACATGVATFSAVLAAFHGNIHVIVSHDCYGGAARLLGLMQEQGKLTFSFVNLNDLAAVDAAILPQTQIVWAESPTNPLLNIVDFSQLGRFCAQKKLTLIVDNTFMTPLLQRQFDFGADIVMHSTTKYINGHADVISGVVVARSKEHLKKIQFAAKTYGFAAAPFDCWLTLRGSKTLPLRLMQHQANAAVVAEFLRNQSQVAETYYPGLPSHPGHEIAKRQQKGFGGVVSLKLRGGFAAAKAMANSTKVFGIADSLGGVESTISHSATMSHAGMPKAQREIAGITDGVVRLSVGIEAIDDLLADLAQALNQIAA